MTTCVIDAIVLNADMAGDGRLFDIMAPSVSTGAGFYAVDIVRSTLTQSSTSLQVFACCFSVPTLRW